MSDELKKMEKLEKIIDSWHFEASFGGAYKQELIKQIKQWAISRKPKKATLRKTGTNFVALGYNRALADYVKNLEEN